MLTVYRASGHANDCIHISVFCRFVIQTNKQTNEKYIYMFSIQHKRTNLRRPSGPIDLLTKTYKHKTISIRAKNIQPDSRNTNKRYLRGWRLVLLLVVDDVVVLPPAVAMPSATSIAVDFARCFRSVLCRRTLRATFFLRFDRHPWRRQETTK
jgi:hypothetical protein